MDLMLRSRATRVYNGPQMPQRYASSFRDRIRYFYQIR